MKFSLLGEIEDIGKGFSDVLGAIGSFHGVVGDGFKVAGIGLESRGQENGGAGGDGTVNNMGVFDSEPP